ncbi:MAG: peptide-methionine (S)-S-oxide reductase MsrA [Alphaproteobacteria bacterium]|nr:peptide-methionine (S)-S-oxide reductase MsrA [Alphaproteobacteria bacterium]
MTPFRPLLAAVAIMFLSVPAGAEETTYALPPPASEAAQAGDTAVLAGGCFWGMQGVFQHVKGVRSVLAGYAGGNAATAHYEEVGTGTTGHTESVQIRFDPNLISYGEILRIYFSVMDPTTRNAQDPDVGTQYRSEIFAVNDAQRRIAQAYIAQLTKAHSFGALIVTQVGNFTGFYAAEGYHQDYLIRHPDQPYIVFNDLPKIAKLKSLYPKDYVDRAVTVARR